jgi:hypothetical protein
MYMYKRPNFWVESIVRRRAVYASGPYIFHEKDFPSILSPTSNSIAKVQLHEGKEKGPVYVSAAYSATGVSNHKELVNDASSII